MSAQISARTASPVPVRSRLLPALLALVVGLIVLGAPSAALAHDRLLSSDPADGAQLDASPQTITLTFSATPLDVEPMARVTAEDGTVVFEGAPTIGDHTATVSLPSALPAGTTTVDWRVVSEDGHPIEGTFSFHVAEAPAAPAATDTASASAEPTTAEDSTAPEATAAATPTAETSSTSSHGTASGMSTGVLVAILAVIVVIVVIGIVVVARGRRRRD